MSRMIPASSHVQLHVGEEVTFLNGDSMIPRTITIEEVKGRNILGSDGDWYWRPSMRVLLTGDE